MDLDSDSDHHYRHQSGLEQERSGDFHTFVLAELQGKNLHRKARPFGYRLEKIDMPESKSDGEVK